MGGRNLEGKYCGVWGQMREEYLKEHNPDLYEQLQECGELEEYLNGYQIAYSNRAEKMAKEMASERGVNEELYNQDSLEWILETEKIQEEIRVTLAEEICK